MFQFVERERQEHPVATMCRVLGVSTSGYYAWRKRGPSARAQADAELAQRIARIHAQSRGTYGAPRIHAELRLEEGVRCSRKRVARLMRQHGLAGVHRRRPRGLTRRDPEATPAPDLVHRQFTVSAPNRLWVADITQHETGDGWLYVAAILDAFPRRVVGWSMADHLRAELVLQALEMAIGNRHPGPGLVHHSDHASQYTSLPFGRRLEEAGILGSMGTVGDLRGFGPALRAPAQAGTGPGDLRSAGVSAGAMAEGDFGHELVILGEHELTLPLFGLELMASGMRFVQVYPHEKLEAVCTHQNRHNTAFHPSGPTVQTRTLHGAQI
ncbi:MAG: IS3 family transposase [Limnochordaceae bacterium]|nr:IS3 family transposase [Limnochordaceae bacterium]